MSKRSFNEPENAGVRRATRNRKKSQQDQIEEDQSMTESIIALKKMSKKEQMSRLEEDKE